MHMRETEWIRRICFIIVFLVLSVALGHPGEKLKGVVISRRLCIRFRTIPDNPLRYIYICLANRECSRNAPCIHTSHHSNAHEQ